MTIINNPRLKVNLLLPPGPSREKAPPNQTRLICNRRPFHSYQQSKTQSPISPDPLAKLWLDGLIFFCKRYFYSVLLCSTLLLAINKLSNANIGSTTVIRPAKRTWLTTLQNWEVTIPYRNHYCVAGLEWPLKIEDARKLFIKHRAAVWLEISVRWVFSYFTQFNMYGY